MELHSIRLSGNMKTVLIYKDPQVSNLIVEIFNSKDDAIEYLQDQEDQFNGEVIYYIILNGTIKEQGELDFT